MTACCSSVDACTAAASSSSGGARGALRLRRGGGSGDSPSAASSCRMKASTKSASDGPPLPSSGKYDTPDGVDFCRRRCRRCNERDRRLPRTLSPPRSPCCSPLSAVASCKESKSAVPGSPVARRLRRRCDALLATPRGGSLAWLRGSIPCPLPARAEFRAIRPRQCACSLVAAMVLRLRPAGGHRGRRAQKSTSTCLTHS